MHVCFAQILKRNMQQGTLVDTHDRDQSHQYDSNCEQLLHQWGAAAELQHLSWQTSAAHISSIDDAHSHVRKYL